MSQLIFNFPFTTNYFEEDFFVSSSNFEAYKLIETWPKWPSRNINIYGPTGCGKSHLANILKKKINSFFINASDISNNSLALIKLKECLIIDNYENNIEENLLYTIINQTHQSNQYVIINSDQPISSLEIKLEDLKSRLNSFSKITIDLPTDDLIKVVLTKNFSDKQIQIDNKLIDFILKHINRSYEDIFNFIKKIDELSLSTGKSININLIKKVLKQ
ncbi:MAG: HdaA/DnaA family protein [Pelagibacteraceae bacterium]|jgi:chromosomal replication initiation ATPase DnaA